MAGRTLTRLGRVQVAAILALLASILIGVDYVVFRVPSAMREAAATGTASIHPYYGATAAVVFLLCQVAGVIELFQGKPGFIRWIVPPVAYLFIIGVVGAALFGKVEQLVMDSGRAVVLLSLSLAAFDRMRKGRS
jgi:hypothetical protein